MEKVRRRAHERSPEELRVGFGNSFIPERTPQASCKRRNSDQGSITWNTGGERILLPDIHCAPICTPSNAGSFGTVVDHALP